MPSNLLRLVKFLVCIWLTIGLTSCNLSGLSAPTATPSPTFTPLPTDTPIPTDTPEPTATFTPEPTPTATIPAPTQAPATPTIERTLSADEAILVYYINKNEKGPFGCGEALWYIKTKQPKTGVVVNDVRFALSTILSYHSETIGSLYHPGYAANLAVSQVEFKDNGTIVVYLTGTWTKTKDRCDPQRFIDQLRQTIKQFKGVSGIVIYINGTPISDALSRK